MVRVVRTYLGIVPMCVVGVEVVCNGIVAMRIVGVNSCLECCWI